MGWFTNLGINRFRYKSLEPRQELAAEQVYEEPEVNDEPASLSEHEFVDESRRGTRDQPSLRDSAYTGD